MCTKSDPAEARVKGLSKTYGLPPALVRRIQIAAVQSVALFIWSRDMVEKSKKLSEGGTKIDQPTSSLDYRNVFKYPPLLHL